MVPTSLLAARWTARWTVRWAALLSAGAWIVVPGPRAAARADRPLRDGAPLPAARDPARAPERGPAMTALAAGELGRSSHVVLCTLLDRREARGLALARLKVERWIKGSGPSDEITVLVAGPRPTNDPQRPSAAYLDRSPGATYLLFLVQGASEVAYTLENRIEIRGLEGQEKVRAVEAQAALEAVADPEERARGVLAHFLGALEGPGPWTRANAARELAFLAGVRPALFTGAVRGRLERLDAQAAAPAVRTWLSALARRLPPAPPEGAPAAAVAPRPDGPAPLPPTLGPEARQRNLDRLLREAGDQAPVRALLLLRRESDPAQRVWFVDWLAESGHRSALPGLLSLYGQATEPGEREALVRAVGLLGSDREVPWLVERLGSLGVREAALLSLARVRSPDALRALAEAQGRFAAGTEEERDLAVRIGHLLSPAFEAAERVEGRSGPEAPTGSASPPGR